MADTTPNASEDRARSTAEVLVEEFKAIHGAEAWVKVTSTPKAQAFADQAARQSSEQYCEPCSWLPPGGLPGGEELRQLALHAYAVRSLTSDPLNSGIDRENCDALEKDPGQAALCLSGGGVRSAAFALGVLQGLSRWGLLEKFHYLSTVSGGGYIGGWLTAWRFRKDASTVNRGLHLRRATEIGTGEPTPLQRLRFNETFITPQVGLTSVDTWAVTATILRNLLLNWLVWIPLLCGLLLLPHVMQSFLMLAISSQGMSTYFLWWALGLALVAFFTSARSRPDTGRNNLTQGRFIVQFLLPLAVGATFFTVSIAPLLRQSLDAPTHYLRFALGGLTLYLSARLAALLFLAIRDLLFKREQGERNPAVHRYSKVQLALIESAGWAFAGVCTGLMVAAGILLCRQQHEHDLQWLTIAGPPWVLAAILLGEIGYLGATSRSPRGDRDREWLARVSGFIAATALAYLVFSWLVLRGWSTFHEQAIWLKSILVASGIGTILGGLTPLTKATTGVRQRIPLNQVVNVLAAVFIVIGSALLAKLTYSGVQYIAPDVLPNADMNALPFWFLALCVLILLGISALASFFVNINVFSLHAMYRNRLTKTFLGASNTGNDEERNRFDGFSLGDNITMGDIKKQLGDSPRLYPVINIALNILASKNLAWQERKAEPFVCTPHYTGGNAVGYRASERYAGGITLGTAMTISGAAVSPNWGYHSSPVTSFLMMLFNVRLGWWFGNPKGDDRWRFFDTWNLRGPRLSWKIFLQEAFGRTNDDEPWVYVSDGGHFENLGVYEMVRRRCRTIVVSDAGADADCTLEDLGNMARKIAIDLGVQLRFRHIYMSKRSDPPKPGIYAAVATLYYPEGRCGTLIYLKPGVYGGEPVDVRAYAASNRRFPHDSTLNQWFGESQFESYRALGCHVISEICRDRQNPAPACAVATEISLSEFSQKAEKYIQEYSDAYDTNGATLVDIRRWPIPAATPVLAQQVGVSGGHTSIVIQQTGYHQATGQRPFEKTGDSNAPPET